MAFKESDYVYCLKSSPYIFTAGRVYVIGGYYHNNPDYGPHRLGVIENDSGRPAGWKREFFVDLGSFKNISLLERVFYGVE